MAVQMTTAQYQAQYGTPPPAPGPAPLTPTGPVQMTSAQYQQKYGTTPTTVQPVSQEGGLLNTIGQAIGQTNQIVSEIPGQFAQNLNQAYASAGPALVNDVQQGATSMSASPTSDNKIPAVKGAAQVAFRAAGDAAGAIFAPFSAAIQAGLQSITKASPELGNAVSGVINNIADKISNSKALQDYAIAHPNAGEDFNRAVTLALSGEEKPTTKAVGQDLANAAPKIENAVTGAANAIGGGMKDTIQSVKEGVTKISDALAPITDQLPKLNPTEADIVKSRTTSLQAIEDSNKPLRRLSVAASDKGIDVKNIIANTDLLHGSVNENGNISTLGKGEAVDQFNQFMSHYESSVSDALKREGVSIPLSQVEQKMADIVNSSRIAGAGKLRLTNLVDDEIAGLAKDADQNGNISLSKLQDAKITTTSNIDYSKPETKINAKLIGNAYKTLIEDNSGLPVKNLNAELGKFYTIGDYLESLDGKKVAGGRVGKYFAQVIGGIAGGHFGTFGTILGAEIASKIKGLSMSSTFGPEVGSDLQATQAMKDVVSQNKMPRLGLPAPQEGAPKAANNVPIELPQRLPDEKQAQSLNNGQSSASGSNASEGGNTSMNSPAQTIQNNGEPVIKDTIPPEEKVSSKGKAAKKK